MAAGRGIGNLGACVANRVVALGAGFGGMAVAVGTGRAAVVSGSSAAGAAATQRLLTNVAASKAGQMRSMVLMLMRPLAKLYN
jgi:hypothetical protein